MLFLYLRVIIIMEDNHDGIYEIDKIHFGILSSKEIKDMAVVNVTNNKICTEDGTGTIYDPRMGPTRGACVQCGLDVTRCCGHMGYIELNRPIINPIYIQHVVLLLKCFCYTCHRFILNREHMELRGLMAFSGKRRFAALIEYFKRLVICVHCQRTQPDYKISTIDSHNVIHSFHDASSGSKTVIDPQECLVRFENISDDEVRLMGFDPTLVHPKSFIMTRFPVIPTCCRPLIVNEGQCCDDDLTFQQMEIIKNNAMVLTAGGEKYYNNLMFRVSTYFNNTSKKAKHATTGRPIKGIKERIGGKDGYIRNNLLGKRVNQSARTVIGPDPFIDMDTLVVPQIMAQILTIPERVFDRNLELVKTWMESGRVNYLVKPDGRKVNVTRRYHIIKHGDVVVTPNGEKHVVMDTRVDYPDGSQKLVDGVLTPLEKSYETPVEIGDVVHRQLRDGDYVMLNRQPTLHKASMMAMKCKILDIKTLKINLAISKPFNCDFDGDEMNIHVPQSLEARVELELLSRPSQCLISSQASKPNMCIVQDTLSAAYLITKNRDRPLARDRFFQIMMYAHDIVIPIKKRYTFIDIVDAVLPSTLTYTTDDLTIRDGHLVSGVLTKRYLGSTNCSLIKVLNFTYGRDECVKFINNIQYVCNQWLSYYGFSVNAEDCLRSSGDSTAIIDKCLREAEMCHHTYRHPAVREKKIIDCLSKAKDIGMKIAKENLRPTNNFLTTVESGSKGDYFNIAQITGLLGQQTVNNERVHGTMNNGRRTLPHFPLDRKLTVHDEYISKGFIESSFGKGLSPVEFLYHSISGRKGVCDTSLSTAATGYNMRRTLKLTEDIRIQPDGTVRDNHQRLYQTCYNQNGYDPTRLYGGKICDIAFYLRNKSNKNK